MALSLLVEFISEIAQKQLGPLSPEDRQIEIDQIKLLQDDEISHFWTASS
jgi:hypothetical protein